MNLTIDIVVIGLNSARTLTDCLKSVAASKVPPGTLSVFYADGGSQDGSQEMARAWGATVIDVKAASPTPGRQRNAGWRAGTAPLVQFLDSDTVLDPNWLATAVEALEAGADAVCGDRRERNPTFSIFNWIADHEWNGPAGPIDAFGGDVLIRRSALEATGGYDEELIAGEDPELSFRLGKSGYTLVRVAAPMTIHDIAMVRWKQYFKRAHRTGHAYAEVHLRHPDRWGREVRRILFRTGLLVAAVVGMLLSTTSLWWLAGSMVCLGGFLQPRLTSVGRLRADMSLTRKEAILYSWHATFVVIPQFFGMLRFWTGRWFSRPLTNNRVLKAAST